MKNKGNLCFCCSFSELAEMNKELWLEEMIRNFSLVSDEELSDAQCRAWVSCREVLVKALRKLPQAYNNVWLVFEYVLPRHKPGTKKSDTERGIRPDVLVVGKDFVTVLEFKQRKLDVDGSVYKGFISQAQKYVTRLNKYHSEAQNMYVAPAVVLTLEKKLLLDRDEYVVCSSDMLAEALVLLNGDKPSSLSIKEMERWLCSI